MHGELKGALTAEVSSTERRRLRSALRQLRGEAGLTQEQVATEMDWSLSKVIRIETGAVSVSTNDVRGLLNLFNVSDKAEIDRLVGLARTARQKPWWYAYRDHFAPAFQSYLDLEAGASSLKLYQPMIIPGLVQTEAYARAANQATAAEPMSPGQLDLEVEVRMRRQRAVLDREESPEIVVLLEQAVLMRNFGDATALEGELHHLYELAQRPRVSIRVLPFTAPVSAGSFGAFIILDFEDEADGPAVYVEGFQNAQQVRSQQQQTAPFLRLFERLRLASLSDEESVELIRRTASQLS